MPNRDPVKQQEYTRTYYLTHKEESNERSRAWHTAHKEQANRASRAYHNAHKDELNEKRRAHFRQHHEEALEYHRRANRQIKLDVLQHYSRKPPFCLYCGEDDVRVLCIDHINNGGTKHRKVTGGGSSFHRWLKTNGYPEGYQILCANCNMRKEFERVHKE